MADQGKTESPTQRRLKKAREEGQFPAAREFVAALQFCVFLGLLGAFGAAWFSGFRQTAQSVFAMAMSGRDLHPIDVTHIARQIFWRQVAPLLAAGLVVAAATIFFRLATTRFGLSLKKVAPDFSRLSPAAKLKQLPGQNLSSLVQAVVLLPMFLWSVYAVVRDRVDAFLALPFQSVPSGFSVLNASLMALFWKAAGVFLIVGAVDLFRQVKRYQSELRMSKQEIKDEYKETEGNPQMKARVRRIQRDRARRHMMKEIPTATAVVVNPTHYAVALRYSLESSAAPTVVAKGKNYLAQRIRQKAIEHQVPIVENPPLARALYQACEPGQEIPPHLYRAVAEILAYIFKLMNGRKVG